MSEPASPQAAQSTETSPVLNARVFSMPAAYRHGKEAKLVEPTKETHKPVVPPPVPVPPKPVAPPLVPPKQASKKTHTMRALVIAGVIFVFALAVSGYILLRSLQTPEPTPTPIVQPTPEPTPAPEPEPAPESIPLPEDETPPPTSGNDTDSDGLTNIEENVVYKTNPNLPDTDADGFLDGNEVFHRYNPKGLAPGTLLEAGIVQETSDSLITLSYPTIWSIEVDEVEGMRVKSTTSETILLQRSPLQSENQNRLETWIDEHGGQSKVAKTITKNGYDLYVSDNQLEAIMVFDDQVLMVTYQLGIKKTLDYLQTFQMLLNSVEYQPPTPSL